MITAIVRMPSSDANFLFQTVHQNQQSPRIAQITAFYPFCVIAYWHFIFYCVISPIQHLSCLSFIIWPKYQIPLTFKFHQFKMFFFHLSVSIPHLVNTFFQHFHRISSFVRNCLEQPLCFNPCCKFLHLFQFIFWKFFIQPNQRTILLKH